MSGGLHNLLICCGPIPEGGTPGCCAPCPICGTPLHLCGHRMTTSRGTRRTEPDKETDRD